MNDNFTKKNNKLLWIELLRILAMLWIIAFHFCDHGTVDMIQTTISPNWLIMAFMRVGGGIGNCLFVLITGYLLYDKKFKIERLLRLYSEVYIYSILSLLICIFFGLEKINIVEFIRSLLPISGNIYWFISSYILLSFLSPFINIIIKNINKENHITLIVILFVFCSVIPTLTYADWPNSGGHIEIFILLYLIGALIRKYNLFNKKSYIYFRLFLITVFIMILSEIVLKMISPVNFTYFIWTMKKSTVIIASILMFIGFKNICLNIPKSVLFWSENVFGIYLIHIGRTANIFFKKMFNIASIYNSAIFFLYIGLFVVAIYILCTFIDKLRIFVFKHLHSFMINKIPNRCKTFFNSFIAYINKLLLVNI